MHFYGFTDSIFFCQTSAQVPTSSEKKMSDQVFGLNLALTRSDRKAAIDFPSFFEAFFICSSTSSGT